MRERGGEGERGKLFLSESTQLLGCGMVTNRSDEVEPVYVSIEWCHVFHGRQLWNGILLQDHTSCHVVHLMTCITWQLCSSHFFGFTQMCRVSGYQGIRVSYLDWGAFSHWLF